MNAHTYGIYFINSETYFHISERTLRAHGKSQAAAVMWELAVVPGGPDCAIFQSLKNHLKNRWVLVVGHKLAGFCATAERQSQNNSEVLLKGVASAMLFVSFSFYLFLAVLGTPCCTGFAPVVKGRATLSSWCSGFSLQWLLLLRCTGSGAHGLYCCGAQA